MPGAAIVDSPEFRAYTSAREDLDIAHRHLVGRWRNVVPSVDEWIRQARVGMTVERLGLGYQATAYDGVTITLSRLREARGELSAEMAVERWGQHLYQARFNLSAGQARASTAALLEKHPFGKAGRGMNPIDWREVLEQLAVQVLALERAGDPTETIGDRPLAMVAPRVIDPYLPEAVSLLWAPQGTGKSTFAVAVALTLETYAEVIPGWHPRTERRVMVLDWEASGQEWNDRLLRVAAGVGLEPPVIAYRRMRRPLADHVEDLAAEMDRRSIGFLVVDSFEKAAGAMADGSTYEDKANRMFTALDRLAVPALVLDHIAGEDLRGGPSKVTPKSIGSVLKGAWARATYDLKRDPTASATGRDELVLHNVKMNDAAQLPPFEFAIVTDGDRGPIRFERSRLTSPELLASLPKREQMRRHLQTHGSLPTKELADLLNVSEATVRALVSRHPEFQSLPGVGVTLVAEEPS